MISIQSTFANMRKVFAAELCSLQSLRQFLLKAGGFKYCCVKFTLARLLRKAGVKPWAAENLRI